jgi:hypothetical protein
MESSCTHRKGYVLDDVSYNFCDITFFNIDMQNSMSLVKHCMFCNLQDNLMIRTQFFL